MSEFFWLLAFESPTQRFFCEAGFVTTSPGEAFQGESRIGKATLGMVFQRLSNYATTSRGAARNGEAWPVSPVGPLPVVAIHGKTRFFSKGVFMRKLKLSELILDFDVYPRSTIDTYHAGEMSRAVEAGAVLPPIVICKKSKRIVDGFHRQRVYSRLHGEDYEVDVVEKTYKTDAELFLDAIRYNAHHGLRMDTHDKAHCILRAKELKVDAATLAGVLCVDPKRIGELTVNRTATTGKLHVPVALKRTYSHLAGKQLTKSQVEANRKSSGMNQQFYVNQIIDLIESDSLDISDEVLMERLKHLNGLLSDLLVTA